MSMCGPGMNSSCCPPSQIFKEEYCGNFNGPLTDEEVWSAPDWSYFAGTFQLFNSASSTGAVTAGGSVTLNVPQGNTSSQSVENPTSFTITAAEGDSGTYCITLYRRVLA